MCARVRVRTCVRVRCVYARVYMFEHVIIITTYNCFFQLYAGMQIILYTIVDQPTCCILINHDKTSSMQIYAHLDVNLARKNSGILTFMTLKMTLKFKIQGGIHPRLFVYTMIY